jgi:hypothetical protein
MESPAIMLPDHGNFETILISMLVEREKEMVELGKEELVKEQIALLLKK